MNKPEKKKPSLDEYTKKHEFDKKLEGKYEIPEYVKSDRITDYTKYSKPESVIKINDSDFAVRGDFSIIGGLPKVGKTTICSFIIATAFMKEIPEGFDSLGIRTSYCGNKPVVYFDTEQPKSNTGGLLKKINRLMGWKDNYCPENLYIQNLRKYDSKEKYSRIFHCMNDMPDTHLWIVDGVADLIRDPNNTEQAFEVIERFMRETDRLNTTVVLHLHENPGGGKLRGNLGSEAERKCGGSIALKKENGIHSIIPRVLRNSENFETIYFNYSKIEKRMVTADSELVESIRSKPDPKEKKERQRFEMAMKITQEGKIILPYNDAWNEVIRWSKIVEGKEIGERTAKTRITEMYDMKLLEKDDAGNYKLLDV